MDNKTHMPFRWAARVVKSGVLALLIIGCLHDYGQLSLTSAQAQSSQQKTAKGERPRPQSPMQRCITSWDRATQMSKQEWKETCKRTVKANPDLYGRPY